MEPLRRAFLVAVLLACFSAAATSSQEPSGLGWKPHLLKQGDGKGGWVYRACELRFLHKPAGKSMMPFGLAQMDNGEVVLLASWNDGTGEKPVVSISRDHGDTWSEPQVIPEGGGRPMMLAYLGKGNLTFISNMRFFSSDYGRTWTERVPVKAAPNGSYWGVEGNPLVDRDASGVATQLAEIGYNYQSGGSWPDGYCDVFIRWSKDGGRTWPDEKKVDAWYWSETADGKTYRRGISEGSLVRAKNGWLVAALRTDMPARYFKQPNNDSLEGTGVSISKDNGKTWSPVKILYDAGRHHAHLVRMPNGDLLMTVIVRTDVRDRRLASYRRGCDAIISRDNGLTWDLGRKYILDDFEFFDGKEWFNGETGHLYSTLLDNGYVLTAFGNYLAKGPCLVRWKP